MPTGIVSELLQRQFRSTVRFAPHKAWRVLHSGLRVSHAQLHRSDLPESLVGQIFPRILMGLCRILVGPCRILVGLCRILVELSGCELDFVGFSWSFVGFSWSFVGFSRAVCPAWQQMLEKRRSSVYNPQRSHALEIPHVMAQLLKHLVSRHCACGCGMISPHIRASYCESLRIYAEHFFRNSSSCISQRRGND